MARCRFCGFINFVIISLWFCLVKISEYEKMEFEWVLEYVHHSIFDLKGGNINFDY